MDLTEEIILQHGKNSPHKGKINKPTLSVKSGNPMCGDKLRMDINVDKDKVTEIVFEGEGCLISQASASLLIGEAKKVKDIKKIKRFDKKTVLKLLGVVPTPSRLQCALLPLKALQQVFL